MLAKAVRIRNFYKLMAEGHSIRSATKIAEASAPQALMDWAAAVVQLKGQKMEHGLQLWGAESGVALAWLCTAKPKAKLRTL
jgi:hypothetical protein